jgi:hypothetical protein
MRGFTKLGPYKDVIEAPGLEDHGKIVKIGLRGDGFPLLTLSAIGQYYGLVQEGLIAARHLFRGLNRALDFDGDMNADQSVFAYTWRPAFDFEWSGSRDGGSPQRIGSPPGNRVFAVLVRQAEPNEHEVVGSIEHWSWIREDRRLPGAPVEWEQRYKERLWSRDI